MQLKQKIELLNHLSWSQKHMLLGQIASATGNGRACTVIVETRATFFQRLRLSTPISVGKEGGREGRRDNLANVMVSGPLFNVHFRFLLVPRTRCYAKLDMLGGMQHSAAADKDST